MKRISSLLLALAAALAHANDSLPSAPAAPVGVPTADFPERPRLWVYVPANPTDCQGLHPAYVTGREGVRPGIGRQIAAPFELRWQGGVLRQPRQALQDAAGPHLLGYCFVLERGLSAPVVQGAVLPSYSERLLRTPALVLVSAPGKPLRFQLLPAFPATVHDPVSADWALLLPDAR